VKRGDVYMNSNFIPKFVPVEQRKSLISIRLNDLTIEKIDKMAAKNNLSRNEMIKQMLDYVLANTKDDDVKK
jgi:metal-responsive CopG/Arc/MetJ family transcriptional regulator